MFKELLSEIENFSFNRNKLIYHNGSKTILKTKLSKSDFFKKSELYQKILNQTSFLDKNYDNVDIYTRIKFILNNTNKLEKCKICGNNASFSKSSDYRVIFNNTCNSKTCIAKLASSNIKSQTEEIKEKHKETILKYKKQIIDTYNEFIDDFYKNNFDLIQKDTLKKWISDKLETKKFKKSTIFQNKTLNEFKKYILSLLRFTDFIDIPKKINKVTELKFSERIFCLCNNITEYPKCPYCNNKLKFVSASYGYSEVCHSCISNKNREILGYPSLKEIESYIDKSKYEIISFPKYTDTEPLVIKCKKCGTVTKTWLYNGRGKNIENMLLCSFCEKYKSNEENEVIDFIKTFYNGEILKNTKNIIHPYEIDIYIPDKKLAIEFDGLYWHSDLKVKNKNYHKIKTEQCEEHGIQLIHIFENEWLTKSNIVKSRIKNLFGCYEKTIYARKCEVKMIRTSVSRKFLDENHIQGNAHSPINIGLFNNNELVSVMTFSKSRFSKKHEYELVRFCNKLGYHIPGSAGKLLKYFERTYKPKSLISYADRRWSIGKLYVALNFKLIDKTSPNYWYFKTSNGILYSRLKFQKHKLKNILPIYSERLTESENMKKNGYKRIFDCGNLVFVKHYN